MSSKMKAELQYNDLEIGMYVVDAHGDEGVINHIEDIHNVEVVFTEGGVGLYCFADGCEYNTIKLYKKQ